MEPAKEKLFVANLKREATGESLINYFSQYGRVKDALVVVDKETRLSKGFGFVTFDDAAVADTVLEQEHVILGRKVDAKVAKPKSQSERRQEQSNQTSDNECNGEINGCDIQFNSRKIFVGGLPSNINEEQFKRFFEKFGTIGDAVVMYDKMSRRPRGFGFITFDSEESVNMVLKDKYHQLNGSLVEVKRAKPKQKIYNSQLSSYTKNSWRFGGQGSSYDYGNVVLMGDQYFWNMNIYPHWYPAYGPWFSYGGWDGSQVLTYGCDNSSTMANFDS